MGFVLVLIHPAPILVTITAVNPARSTGVAQFAGGEDMAPLWLCWLTPVAGAPVAGALTKWVYEDTEIVDTVVVEGRAA
ncbi:hypothetical protein ACLBXO_28085 [Methylobacterium sp. C33D]